MAQLINVRLTRPENCPLGFRIHGGKDFGTPLVIQKVNGGSPAEKAGLLAGDSVIKVNTTDVFNLKHKEAQDIIVNAGLNFDICVQRGGSTWKPSVTPVGSIPSPNSKFQCASPVVTQTSLKANNQQAQHIGSGYNSAAKPFNYMNGNGDTVKSIVNKQYNTPVGIYSEETIAETLSAQAEVLAGGVLGVNFKKNEKTYEKEKSEVFKMLQEADNEPEPDVATHSPSGGASGLRHVTAPVTRPDAPINNTGGLPPGQNICEECERLIIGVFVRIKDKNLHVECFKCATCGSSLKNQGYYNLNGKLYCDIHAKMVARQNPPAPNLEPVTMMPNNNMPASTITSALASHTMPLLPLSNPIPPMSGNGPSMFSPSSNISGPKPFGSPMSPAAPISACSLSPRSMPSIPSAPISPACTLQRPIQQAAPIPPPFSAPALAMQPTPAKGVKSVVWPPVQSEEESENESSQPVLPCQSPKPIYRTEPAPQMPAPWLLKQSRSGPDSHHVKFSEQLVEEKILDSAESVTSEMSQEFSSAMHSSSMMSQTSSSMMSQSSNSTMTSTQNYQTTAPMLSISSQMIEGNVSQQKSDLLLKEVAQTKMYKSETGEPIQTTFNEPLADTMAVKEIKEVEQINETKIHKHKESICSAEVSQITERRTPIECVETISEAVDTQNLVSSMIRNETPRPASPTPEDVSSPLIEKQTFEEMCSSSVAKEENNNEIQIAYKDNMEFSGIQTHEHSFLEAVTTAPERPYSPFPSTTQAPTVCTYTHIEEHIKEPEVKVSENLMQLQTEAVTVSQSSAVESTESEQVSFKKTYCSIPPIKPYVPINKTSGETFSMPEETTPYFPPEISMTIEPRPPRDGAISPFVSALTVAPARPYTPLGAQPIERGSLVEALTVAPVRPFTPITSECASHFTESISQSMTQTQSQSLTTNSTSFECIKPVATQPCQTFMQTSQAPIQTACQLQSSIQTSAFKPVMRSVQTFPPPPPCEFAGEPVSFPPVTEELKAHYANNSLQCQTMTSESHQISQSCEQFTSRKSFENKQMVFEQSLQDEKLSSYAKNQSSGLHMPSHLPCYQQHLEHLPSQMGITPEVVSDPPILQAPITPVMATESNNPTIKKVQRPAEPEPLPPVITYPPPQMIPEIETISDFHKDVPITMTFQPVSDNINLRTTPIIRSRPHTPSLINKPAPLIPYYQMNLISVEHNAAETNLYEPSSPDVSRSPTPKLRTQSPAPGPPGNPLKAPRVKEAPQQHQPLLCKATSNLRKEHEMIQAKFEGGVETYNASGAKNWCSTQQSAYETEHKESKIGFHSQQNVQTMVSESSVINQQNMQQACETQMTYESGMNSVQKTKKMFEEFERSRSAKTIEIQRRGSNSSTKILSSYPPVQLPQSNLYQLNNIQSEAVKPSIPSQLQTFPPTNFSTQMNMAPKPSSVSGQPPFTNSGANNKTSGPVCDPTPSAGAASGAGAGAGGRGKAFGVSSAPKRGRGILNKAAVPGTRVPLCGHCNGQIRGPFITALGRIWCPDHFVCVNNTCRRQLQDIGFVEENGQLYCEYCFEQFIAPACDKCHGKIKGDCLNAIGKHFHPECFSCAYCGKLFGNNPFFLEEGLPYCEADWNELFTTKCFACGFPVEAGDRWVEALNNNYHSQCFNCTMCKKNLEGQSFYAKGGRPFCKNHAR